MNNVETAEFIDKQDNISLNYLNHWDDEDAEFVPLEGGWELVPEKEKLHEIPKMRSRSKKSRYKEKHHELMLNAEQIPEEGNPKRKTRMAQQGP